MRRKPSQRSLYSTTIDSPLGELLLVKSDVGLRHIGFEEDDFAAVVAAQSAALGVECASERGAFAEERIQLDAYFAGDLHSFTLSIDLPPTGFRQRVQLALADIGYGKTITYGELAARLANPGAARAVGSACATNPLPIALPCHRVLAAGGNLGGYSGQLWRKTWLLEREGVE